MEDQYLYKYLNGFLLGDFSNPFDENVSDSEIALEYINSYDFSDSNNVKYFFDVLKEIEIACSQPVRMWNHIASWANRDFETPEECQQWLGMIRDVMRKRFNERIAEEGIEGINPI